MNEFYQIEDTREFANYEIEAEERAQAPFHVADFWPLPAGSIITHADDAETRVEYPDGIVRSFGFVADCGKTPEMWSLRNNVMTEVRDRILAEIENGSYKIGQPVPKIRYEVFFDTGNSVTNFDEIF